MLMYTFSSLSPCLQKHFFNFDEAVSQVECPISWGSVWQGTSKLSWTFDVKLSIQARTAPSYTERSAWFKCANVWTRSILPRIFRRHTGISQRVAKEISPRLWFPFFVPRGLVHKFAMISLLEEFFVAVKIMSGFLNCFRKLKQLMTAAQAWHQIELTRKSCQYCALAHIRRHGFYDLVSDIDTVLRNWER